MTSTWRTSTLSEDWAAWVDSLAAPKRTKNTRKNNSKSKSKSKSKGKSRRGSATACESSGHTSTSSAPQVTDADSTPTASQQTLEPKPISACIDAIVGYGDCYTGQKRRKLLSLFNESAQPLKTAILRHSKSLEETGLLRVLATLIDYRTLHADTILSSLDSHVRAAIIEAIPLPGVLAQPTDIKSLQAWLLCLASFVPADGVRINLSCSAQLRALLMGAVDWTPPSSILAGVLRVYDALTDINSDFHIVSCSVLFDPEGRRIASHDIGLEGSPKAEQPPRALPPGSTPSTASAKHTTHLKIRIRVRKEDDEKGEAASAHGHREKEGKKRPKGRLATNTQAPPPILAAVVGQDVGTNCSTSEGKPCMTAARAEHAPSTDAAVSHGEAKGIKNDNSQGDPPTKRPKVAIPSLSSATPSSMLRTRSAEKPPSKPTAPKEDSVAHVKRQSPPVVEMLSHSFNEDVDGGAAPFDEHRSKSMRKEKVPSTYGEVVMRLRELLCNRDPEVRHYSANILANLVRFSAAVARLAHDLDILTPLFKLFALSRLNKKQRATSGASLQLAALNCLWELADNDVWSTSTKHMNAVLSILSRGIPSPKLSRPTGLVIERQRAALHVLAGMVRNAHVGRRLAELGALEKVFKFAEQNNFPAFAQTFTLPLSQFIGNFINNGVDKSSGLQKAPDALIDAFHQAVSSPRDIISCSACFGLSSLALVPALRKRLASNALLLEDVMRTCMTSSQPREPISMILNVTNSSPLACDTVAQLEHDHHYLLPILKSPEYSNTVKYYCCGIFNNVLYYSEKAMSLLEPLFDFVPFCVDLAQHTIGTYAIETLFSFVDGKPEAFFESDILDKIAKFCLCNKDGGGLSRAARQVLKLLLNVIEDPEHPFTTLQSHIDSIKLTLSLYGTLFDRGGSEQGHDHPSSDVEYIPDQKKAEIAKALSLETHDSNNNNNNNNNNNSVSVVDDTRVPTCSYSSVIGSNEGSAELAAAFHIEAEVDRRPQGADTTSALSEECFEDLSQSVAGVTLPTTTTTPSLSVSRASLLTYATGQDCVGSDISPHGPFEGSSSSSDDHQGKDVPVVELQEEVNNDSSSESVDLAGFNLFGETEPPSLLTEPSFHPANDEQGRNHSRPSVTHRMTRISPLHSRQLSKVAELRRLMKATNALRPAEGTKSLLPRSRTRKCKQQALDARPWLAPTDPPHQHQHQPQPQPLSKAQSTARSRSQSCSRLQPPKLEQQCEEGIDQSRRAISRSRDGKKSGGKGARPSLQARRGSKPQKKCESGKVGAQAKTSVPSRSKHKSGKAEAAYIDGNQRRDARATEYSTMSFFPFYYHPSSASSSESESSESPAEPSKLSVKPTPSTAPAPRSAKPTVKVQGEVVIDSGCMHGTSKLRCQGTRWDEERANKKLERKRKRKKRRNQHQPCLGSCPHCCGHRFQKRPLPQWFKMPRGPIEVDIAEEVRSLPAPIWTRNSASARVFSRPTPRRAAAVVVANDTTSSQAAPHRAQSGPANAIDLSSTKLVSSSRSKANDHGRPAPTASALSALSPPSVLDERQPLSQHGSWSPPDPIPQHRSPPVPDDDKDKDKNRTNDRERFEAVEAHALGTRLVTPEKLGSCDGAPDLRVPSDPLQRKQRRHLRHHQQPPHLLENMRRDTIGVAQRSSPTQVPHERAEKEQVCRHDTGEDLVQEQQHFPHDAASQPQPQPRPQQHWNGHPYHQQCHTLPLQISPYQQHMHQFTHQDGLKAGAVPSAYYMPNPGHHEVAPTAAMSRQNATSPIYSQHHKHQPQHMRQPQQQPLHMFRSDLSSQHRAVTPTVPAQAFGLIPFQHYHHHQHLYTHPGNERPR